MASCAWAGAPMNHLLPIVAFAGGESLLQSVLLWKLNIYYSVQHILLFSVHCRGHESLLNPRLIRNTHLNGTHGILYWVLLACCNAKLIAGTQQPTRKCLPNSRGISNNWLRLLAPEDRGLLHVLASTLDIHKHWHEGLKGSAEKDGKGKGRRGKAAPRAEDVRVFSRLEHHF